jgi:hypothetical protein
MIDSKRLAATVVGAYGFYDREISDFAMQIWADALDGIEPEVIDAAFARHLRDPDAGRFCPKPADILRQIRGDADDQALIAWGQVISAAKAGGGRFDGPTQEAIDSMGGMGRIRMSNESENSFLQRQFVAAFKAYKAREESPPLLANVVKQIGRAA